MKDSDELLRQGNVVLAILIVGTILLFVAAIVVG